MKIRDLLFLKNNSLLILVIFLISSLLFLSCNNDDDATVVPVEIAFVENTPIVLENNEEGITVEVGFEAATSGGSFIIELSGAEYGIDYTTNPDGASGEIFIPVQIGQTLRSFQFFPINNNQIHEDKEVSITLKEVANGVTLSNTTSSIVVIEDDEKEVVVNFNQSTYLVEENNPDGIDLLIDFDEPALFEGSFELNFTGGELRTDFTTNLSDTSNPLSVPVAIGDESVSVKIIPVNNEVEAQNNVVLTVTLVASSPAVEIGTVSTTASIEIVDDDGNSIINFDPTSYLVLETAAELDMAITVFPALAKASTIDVNITSTDAVYGVDYTTMPDGSTGSITLNLSIGSENESIKIIPIDNDIAAPDKALQFTLNNPTGTLDVGTLDRADVVIDSEETLIVAYTSFEEPVIPASIEFGFYSNNGPGTEDHDLVNVATHAPVDYTSVGGEMGYDASWIHVFDIRPGFEGWGIINQNRLASNGTFDGEVIIPSIPEGDQMYRVKDARGEYKLVFDAINLTGFSSTELSFEFFVGGEGFVGGPSTYDGEDGGVFI